MLSLQAAMSSEDSKVACLATTLLNLQQSILNQFQLVSFDIGLDDACSGANLETDNNFWTTDNIADSSSPLLISNSVSERRSVGFGNDSGDHGNHGGPFSHSSRSFSVSLPRGSQTSLASPPESPRRKSALATLESSNTRITMEQLFEETEPISAELIPTLEHSEECDILERLLERIRIKITKAKWTRDLQEFTVDNTLSASSFENVKKTMNLAISTAGKRWIRSLSNSVRRPCWGILGCKVGETFGEYEAKKFEQMSIILQADHEFGIKIHTIYVFYDLDREQISLKAICSPIDERIIDSLGDYSDQESA